MQLDQAQHTQENHSGPPDEFSSSEPIADALETSSAEVRAAIDVGTNSVKLLVGKVKGQEVVPVTEESKQTRLGAGFYETHRLQPEPIRATADAVSVFAAKARRFGVSNIAVIGTSAARDATNSAELIQAIREKSNLTLRVISGEQEADWAFHGVTSDPQLADLALLILDVGGGSTEFIVGEHSKKTFSHSHKLGTVRLLESMRLKDPPGMDALKECRKRVDDFIREKISPDVTPALRDCAQKPQLVGTGGTATILARIETGAQDFNRAQIEATRISLTRLHAHADWLWHHTLAERMNLPGLPPKRADVILGGVVIYQSIMELFGFSELRVSTRGLRYSALLNA